MASDYGVTGWAVDLSEAAQQAITWIGDVAEAKGWANTDEHGAAMDLIGQAWDRAEGTSNEARSFWTALAELWDSESPDREPPGWDKLSGVFHSAAGTAKTTQEGRELGDTLTILQGTVDGIAEDVAEGADWWGKHGKKVMIGGAILAAVIWWRKG